MTVSQLINQLNKLPPNMQVIIQTDSIGNYHSNLSSVDDGYICELDHFGEIDIVYNTDWNFIDAEFPTEEEWEQYKQENPKCCVLVPTIS